MHNRATGNVGEALAIARLTRDGFEIVTTNYRNKLGEIDIIATRNARLHFIEVKYRRTNKFGLGREAVTFPKQKRIRNIATVYLKFHGLYNKIHVSFDVIEIQGEKIEHIIGCF